VCNQRYRRPIDHVRRRHRRAMFDSFLNRTLNYFIADYCTICKRKFTGSTLSHVRSKHEGKAAKEFVVAGLLG
jgi:hypothetical protein